MSSSRRDFLAAFAAGGAGLLTTDWPGVREALAHSAAVRSGGVPAAFGTLTAAEAATVAAIAARIVPTTQTPGATEAGVVFFIDKALAGFAAPALPDLRAGLADLRKRTAARAPGTASFAARTRADQDALLVEIEETRFFGMMRGLVMMGMFSDPMYGGNRGQVGWKLIGFQSAMSHAPPFGYYDAEYAAGRD